MSRPARSRWKDQGRPILAPAGGELSPPCWAPEDGGFSENRPSAGSASRAGPLASKLIEASETKQDAAADLAVHPGYPR